MRWLERLTRIDRRWIFATIGLGTLLPLIIPIGLPVSTTPPVRSLFERLESLGPDDVLLLSIDYGPTVEAELGPMTAALLRHAFSRRIKVVMIALFPIGALSEGRAKLNLMQAEFPELQYGVDFAYLGYKEGAQAALRRMSDDLHGVFPTDVDGRLVGEIPLLQRVHGYRDLAAGISLATGLIGEYYVNLVNAQYGLPVAVGCTAVSAPRFYSFYEAGQMFGLLGGLKAASEYEQLLLERYPQHAKVYHDPAIYSATKGMDVQTIDHAIVIGFIVLGNLTYLLTRRRREARP